MDAAPQALLARIVADPHDLDTRVVYADAIGGELGELIALETELVRSGIRGLDDLVFGELAGDALAVRAAQLRRARKLRADLLPAMRDELAERIDTTEILFPISFALRHGLVGHAEVTQPTIEAFARLLELAPIESVSILVRDPAGIAALARLPLHRIREVELAGFPAGAPEMRALFAAMPRLRTLRFRWQPRAADIVALGDAPLLVDLTIGRPTNDVMRVLATSSIAQRLERLALTEAADSDEPHAHGALDDPLAVFDGTFANASEISLHMMRVPAATLRQRPLVFPATVTFSSLFLDQVHTLARIANRLGTVRSLDLRGNDLDDGALAGIVQHATALERLGIEGKRLGTRSFHALSRVQLRRLWLGSVAGNEASLVAAHPLVELHVSLPHTEVLEAIAPKPPTLRALVTQATPFDRETVRRVASAPGFAQLRRIRVTGGGALPHGIDALAGLPALVELSCRDAMARPTLSLVEHPTLVDFELERTRGAELHGAIAERFGGPDLRVRGLVLFEPRAFQRTTVQRILEHFGHVEDRGDRLGLTLPGHAVGDLDASFVLEPPLYGPQLLAAAIAEPTIAAQIVGATRAISVHTFATPVAALYPCMRALQDNLGGILWDAFEDRITTI